MKVNLRTPNELFWDEYDIDPKDFIVESEFEDQVFGTWREVTVAMDIESYNKIKHETKNITKR
jgi:hypothetical protein